ncbi:MAG TPA: hypothetical protein DCQ14_00590 [Firmicutes bacterium]|nr:hypothetical protein [Bacillota bacterium]
MLEETSILKEITRLREQMHSIYKRDKRISAAVLAASLKLDKQINIFMRANKVITGPARPPQA